jgi:hypothetical protein
MSVLNNSEIDSLLRGQPITDEWPWNISDEATIDRHYKDVLAEVCRRCAVLEKSEWNHYGSGYASYVDCWLYQETDEFRSGPRDHFHGLVILLSRLSHFYVIGEGEKSWHSHGGVSYMLGFDLVDGVKTPAVARVVEPVCAVLDGRGLVRLRKNQLSDPLPPWTRIPGVLTILSDPPYLHFDALFHWED